MQHDTVWLVSVDTTICTSGKARKGNERLPDNTARRRDTDRRTRRLLTSSFTLAAVSDDCFPLDASLISVDRKFLHFFTFSRVSWREAKKARPKKDRDRENMKLNIAAKSTAAKSNHLRC